MGLRSSGLRASWLAPWLLVLAVGCDSKTTEDDSGDPVDFGPPGQAACIETITVLAVDAPSALGFSAQQLLEGKLGTRDAELTFANEPTNLSEAIKNLVLPLQVTLSYEGGEVRDVHSEQDPEYDYGGQLGGFIECVSRLEVDVALDVVTEGRELDEHVQTALHATAVEGASLTGSSRVELGVDLFPPALQGSLDPADLHDDPATDVVALVFLGQWFEELAGGALFAEVHADIGGDGGWFGFGPLASWGDEIPPPEPE